MLSKNMCHFKNHENQKMADLNLKFQLSKILGEITHSFLVIDFEVGEGMISSLGVILESATSPFSPDQGN